MPDGTPDSVRGIREFVFGTGGKGLRPLVRPSPTARFATSPLSAFSGSPWKPTATTGNSFQKKGSRSPTPAAAPAT